MVAVYKDTLECLLLSNPKNKCAGVFALKARFDNEDLDLTKTNSIDAVTPRGGPAIQNLFRHEKCRVAIW